MQVRQNRQDVRQGILLAGLAFVGMTLWLPVNPAHAMQLYEGDSLIVQFDSTVTYGMMWRVAERDEGIIGIANGGTKNTVNYDDGNLNYDKGLVSSLGKITCDLDIATENYGVFSRGKAFYDYVNMNQDRERTVLTDVAEDKVGKNAELLDAYLWAAIDLGKVPVQVRLGEQVVSWGESTFLQGGINAINPIDVAAIRGPGAELKEALLPEGTIWASAGLTDNISVEGLYLYDWGETELEPLGTYYSYIDFASPGAYKLVLGSGKAPDNGNASVADTMLAVPRGRDYEADDQGQFGLAMRWFVPALNSTEFGFFYLNYNNRLPNLSAKTGTMDGLLAAAAAPNATVALSEYAKTMEYRAEYVNDIQLFGASFSTEVMGLALQGETSFRKDAPIQIDDAEILLHALGPLNPMLGGLSQLGAATSLDTDFEGYVLRDISQVQVTATKVLKPFMGTDGGVLLAEVGVNHVYDMPSKDTLRMEGPGTVNPGDPMAAAALGVSVEPADKFADATSWGYRILGRLDFNNLIGAVNFSPRVAFAHDVKGNSPFGGPFQEDRKSFTLGLGASYQSWSVDLNYTNYFGAGDYNWLNDRDIVAFNIKYSF